MQLIRNRLTHARRLHLDLACFHLLIYLYITFILVHGTQQKRSKCQSACPSVRLPPSHPFKLCYKHNTFNLFPFFTSCREIKRLNDFFCTPKDVSQIMRTTLKSVEICKPVKSVEIDQCINILYRLHLGLAYFFFAY